MIEEISRLIPPTATACLPREGRMAWREVIGELIKLSNGAWMRPAQCSLVCVMMSMLSALWRASAEVPSVGSVRGGGSTRSKQEAFNPRQGQAAEVMLAHSEEHPVRG